MFLGKMTALGRVSFCLPILQGKLGGGEQEVSGLRNDVAPAHPRQTGPTAQIVHSQTPHGGKAVVADDNTPITLMTH